MNLVHLEVTGYKNIEVTAVIDNFGEVTAITGMNRQGKSSMLDAVVALLNGDTKDAINKNSDSATILGTMGKYHIKRVIGKKGNVFEVKTAEGGVISAKEFLEDPDSRIAVNPGKFQKMNDSDKTKHLIKVSGINLDDLDSFIEAATTERLELSRAIKFAGVPVPCAPATYTDITEIEGNNKKARENNRNRDSVKDKLLRNLDAIDAAEAQIKRLKSEVETLEHTLATFEDLEEVDVTEIVSTNEKALKYDKYLKDKKHHEELVKKHAEADKEVKELTEARKQEFKEKFSLISDGEIDIVKGILTINGLAPSQWSRSESMAIASTVETLSAPDASILIMDDAEMFDDEYMAELIKTAKKRNIQVIMAVRHGIPTDADVTLTISQGKLLKEK
jgi:hypothetical protein